MTNSLERPSGELCQRCGQRDAVTPEWVGEELRQQLHKELTDPERLKLLGSTPHPQVPTLLLDIIEIARNSVAFVPQVDPAMPPELRYAMTLSREADLETRCPHCGWPTMWKGHREDRPVVYEHRMVLSCRHAPDCPADQERVLEAFRRWQDTRG